MYVLVTQNMHNTRPFCFFVLARNGFKLSSCGTKTPCLVVFRDLALVLISKDKRWKIMLDGSQCLAAWKSKRGLVNCL